MPRTKYANDAERVMSRVVKSPGGCWLWTDALTKTGYGRLNVGGRVHRAHRFSYETFVGPISAGLTIDHLCRVRHCTNPDHLEPVTQAVNVRRSPDTICSLNAAKTECRSGHPFDDVNTYVTSDGKRRCRTCREESLQRYYARAGGPYAARKACAARRAARQAATA